MPGAGISPTFLVTRPGGCSFPGQWVLFFGQAPRPKNNTQCPRNNTHCLGKEHPTGWVFFFGQEVFFLGRRAGEELGVLFRALGVLSRENSALGLNTQCPGKEHTGHKKSVRNGRGESGWCSDMTSTHGAWRHAEVRFLLLGGSRG